MKKILMTRDGKAVVWLVAGFTVLYVTGLIYTNWHSKQGNLWLMVLEIIAMPLTWFVYLRVIDLKVAVLSRHALGPLPTYLAVIALVLSICHLCGFLATEPDAQRTWAYLPYLTMLGLACIIALMVGAKRHRQHQV